MKFKYSLKMNKFKRFILKPFKIRTFGSKCESIIKKEDVKFENYV